MEFYKKEKSDNIWWVDNREKIGEHLFSFDKITIFNLFKDYPYKLTKEQKEIFDNENQYWKDFFADRQQDFDKTKLLIEINNYNWSGHFATEWDYTNIKIYDNRDCKIVLKNGLNEILEFKYITLDENEYKEILENIELSKNINAQVDACDGDAWDFIQYENNRQVWKRETGYIYGIQTLETISKIINKYISFWNQD